MCLDCSVWLLTYTSRLKSVGLIVCQQRIAVSNMPILQFCYKGRGLLACFTFKLDLQFDMRVSVWVPECRKLADTLKKKTKRKKKTSCHTSLSGDGTPHSTAATSGLDEAESELPVTPKSTPDSESTDAEVAMDHESQPALESLTGHQLTNSRAASVGGDSSVSLSTVPGTSRDMVTTHHSRTSSATADLDSQSSAADVGFEAARQEEVRADLEAAVTQANSAIQVGIAAGDDVLQMVVDELEVAIQQAVEASISAKYSKKVRKRLQLLLQEAVTAAAGDEDSGAAALPAAAYDTPALNREWQTAGSKVHRPTSSRAESPAVASSSSCVGSSQSPQHRHHHQHQGSGQGQAHGHFVHVLLPAEAPFGGVAGPPPPPPPRQPLPPPPSQTSSHTSKAEMSSGSASRKTGNAWGVPDKQRSSRQVCYLLLLLLPVPAVTCWYIWPAVTWLTICTSGILVSTAQLTCRKSRTLSQRFVKTTFTGWGSVNAICVSAVAIATACNMYCRERSKAWRNHDYPPSADDVATAADPLAFTPKSAQGRATAVATTRAGCPCSEGCCKSKPAATAAAQSITWHTSAA